MADNRTGRPRRNLDLIAPVTIGLVVAAILAWAVLRPHAPKSPPEPAAPAAPTVIEPPPPKIVEPEAPLTRAELIEAAHAAASAYAAGDPAEAGKDPLVGREFAIRIPFGCRGPQVRPDGAQAYYEVDAKARSVHLIARPASWSQLPLIQGLPAADRPENVEGFWIPRPWTAADTCPPPRNQPAPAAPTPPSSSTLGLARLFDSSSSRVDQRRDRPYDHVIKASDDSTLTPPQGFELRLEGRITGFPDGRAFRCWSESADHRPICLLAIVFDRVAFEDADGALISEWKD
jgi:hypothetical protein